MKKTPKNTNVAIIKNLPRDKVNLTLNSVPIKPVIKKIAPDIKKHQQIPPTLKLAPML